MSLSWLNWSFSLFLTIESRSFMICGRLVPWALHPTTPYLASCTSARLNSQQDARPSHSSVPTLCSWFCLEYICAWWASTHTSTLFPWSPIQPWLLLSIPRPTHLVFIVTDLRERALVKGCWPTDAVAEKAAEAGQTISRNKEVWAAAGVTAKITAPHVEGGDQCCHHHSTRDPSAHTSRSVALDSGTTYHQHYERQCSWNKMLLECLFLPSEWILHQPCFALRELPSLKPGADPLGLLSLPYVSCSSYRQGWASKELTFFLLPYCHWDLLLPNNH